MALNITNGFNNGKLIDQEIVKTLVLGNNTFSKKLAILKPNVKEGSFVLGGLETSVTLQEQSCNPTAAGSMTYTERKIQTVNVQAFDEFCYLNLKDVLTDAGFTFSNKDAKIDLTDMSKDTLISLFQ